ncbi:nuclear transport factor 2 family protein [Xenorhabdus stockiae]|uniref:nuclear transport factor 2 family protein n=1 Tax=Xenorhabdus stockiae TaxID=351614 RepID=UPI00406421A4
MNQENSATYSIIKNLEISLHGEKRYDIKWLNSILHDNFLEIGKSGHIYTKKIVVKFLKEEINIIPQIFSEDFNMQILDKNIVLLTYKSYEVNKRGRSYNKALRSSIWQLSTSGVWQLRFHQGTKIADYQ